MQERNVDFFSDFPMTNWARFFSRMKNRALLRIFTSSLSKGNKGKVLEIGPGDGEFLRSLRSKGLNVSGADISEKICRQIQARLGILMHHGGIESIEQKTTYDGVVANHVVEHVVDAPDFLRKIRSLLKDSGIFLLTCPNIESWDAGWSGWGGYQAYHACYYTPKALSLLVNQASFEIIFLGTRESFSAPWDTLYQTLVVGADPFSEAEMVRAVSGRRRNIVVTFFGNLIKAIFCFGFYPLRKWFEMKQRGDEIVLVARAK